MRIQSNDLPQADRIESVLLATFAIANGALTDIEIANEVPGIEGDARQGRYYRRAAEILGFIVNNRNSAQITAKGLQIVQNLDLTNPVLLESVLNLNLYQKLLPFIELNPGGLSRTEIIDYLQSIAVTNIGPTMIPRRISTIISWIRTLGIIEQVGERYILTKDIILQMPIINMIDIQQPILPSTGNLQEYLDVGNRISNANNLITVYKDQARLERANNAHRVLVNLVANRIRQAGGIPKSNQFIDLATTLEQDYIFEMKSTTENNVTSQVRKGISQLYEYRYLENRPNANLILVIENPLTQNDSWIRDYMEIDRNIHLVWDGDGNLYGSEISRQQLGFLNLK